VDIRITRQAGATLIEVAGALTAESANLLEQECATASRPVILDLRDLMKIDDDGLDTIRRLQQAGARTVNVSPYMELQLHHGS
jgi:anti-anti-sigma regulatory factor